MAQVATSPTAVVWKHDFGSEIEEAKDIYRQHGWLTDNYRKDECLEAVVELYLDIP